MAAIGVGALAAAAAGGVVMERKRRKSRRKRISQHAALDAFFASDEALNSGCWDVALQEALETV